MSHAYSILNTSISPTSGSTCKIIYLCMSSEIPTTVTTKITASQKVMSCRAGKNITHFREICNIHLLWWWRQQVTMKWTYIYVPDHMTSRPTKTVTLTFIYILFKSYIKMSSIGYLVFFISQKFMSGSQRRIFMCYCFQHCSHSS
jgi:hypothetical protein